MADQVLYPEVIQDTPLPTLTGVPISAPLSTPSSGQGSTTGNNIQLTPDETREVQFPEKYVAPAVISDTLNSISKQILGNFTFGTLGAISIGTYQNGTSGDVRITPSGITARNIFGQTTFSLDGATGNASFLGTITAGSLIAGAVNVGSASVQIDGANTRILITDESGTPRVLIGFQSGGF
jgi:hypothetical protein